MDVLSEALHWLLAQLQLPLITLGATPVTAGLLIGGLLIILGVWWTASALEALIVRATANNKRLQDSRASVLAWARIVRYGVWILGTIVGLSHIGVDLTSIALLGGAIGIGIGFGLQNIFSNFISGVILLLERTLKVGDFVDLQSGVRGHVREIGLRYTRVTTNDEVDVIVPNSEFINGRVTNWTFETRMRRMRIPFGVAYGTDKTRVRAAALRAAARVDGAVAARPADVWLMRFGESSLEFELVVWVGPERVARPANTLATYLWALDDELRAEKIEIPFPQRDVHIRSMASAASGATEIIDPPRSEGR